MLWHGLRAVSRSEVVHELGEMLILESPSLNELNHERYIPEGIAGGLCLHAHVLTIPSFLDEVIHQGELFRRLELQEIAEEENEWHSPERLDPVPPCGTSRES